MSSEDLERKLFCAIESEGWKCSMVPLAHVKDLSDEIERLHAGGVFDEGFYTYLNKYVTYDIGDIPETGSIIVVSVRQPITNMHFELEGGEFIAYVSPTYNYHTDDDVIDTIERVITPGGHRVEKASLPKKALAAHSGLAEYGRNNITYVSGHGSFHRLVALCTDIPSSSDTWAGPRMAKACVGCEICTRACPTGAIGQDRFLLHSERCLTYFYESEDEIPDWIDKSWHNALIGCLKCQLSCPMNEGHIKDRDNIYFDRKETDMIINGAFEHDPAVLQKLDLVGLKDDAYVVTRNLNDLLDYARRKATFKGRRT